MLIQSKWCPLVKDCNMVGIKSNLQNVFHSVIVLGCLAAMCQASEWSYKGDHGPDKWQIHSYQCGKGQAQSPININAYKATFHIDLTTIKYSDDYTETVTDGKFIIANNGHTVKITPQGGDYNIMLGGLPGVYRLLQYHFHWGSDGDKGSEHTINGDRYPMEAHFVHVNKKYADVNEALLHWDGLAVIALMFKPCGKQDNPGLVPVTDIMDSLVEVGSNISIGSHPLFNIFGKDYNFKNYYRYNGSLTTPECQESVVWTVYHAPTDISCTQMEKFRRLNSDCNSLVDNFRPLQLLRNRKVLRSYRKKCADAAMNDHGVWGYHGGNGPSTWKQHFTECNGRVQSPVNIVTRNVPVDKDLVPFGLTDAYKRVPEGDWALHNDGHSVRVIPTSGEYNLTKGNAPGMYSLVQFHFHWGLDDEHGSEHSFNGEFYPMEMHMVHYNTKYSGLKEALGYSDGLAVLAFVFEISEEGDNEHLQPFVKNLHSVTLPDSRTKIPAINLLKLMGGKTNLKDYYRYHGSLTTPACHEVVLWTIVYRPLKISEVQLNEFRKLNGYEGKLGNNFRPVQPLYGRHIKRSDFKMIQSR